MAQIQPGLEHRQALVRVVPCHTGTALPLAHSHGPLAAVVDGGAKCWDVVAGSAAGWVQSNSAPFCQSPLPAIQIFLCTANTLLHHGTALPTPMLRSQDEAGQPGAAPNEPRTSAGGSPLKAQHLAKGRDPMRRWALPLTVLGPGLAYTRGRGVGWHAYTGLSELC